MLRRSSTYFYLIKRKTSTIYCRIVVGDEQKGRTTGQKIEGEEYWNQSTQRVKDSYPQSESINETLSVIENQVREAENTLISRHEPVTLESLLDIIDEGVKPLLCSNSSTSITGSLKSLLAST